jgi:hypothetical protein
MSAESEQHVNDMNGVGPVVDLGAINRRNQEKERVPAYTVGAPEFALQVGVQVINGAISFRDALDRAALVLGADGFTIEEVKHCAFAGQDQNGAAVFQVIVRVSDAKAPF